MFVTKIQTRIWHTQFIARHQRAALLQDDHVTPHFFHPAPDCPQKIAKPLMTEFGENPPHPSARLQQHETTAP